jgi:hypothetical protein
MAKAKPLGDCEEAIQWITVRKQLPDDDQTVLIANSGESDRVWLGHHEDDGWYFIDGFKIPMNRDITHWAHLPDGPL